MFRLKKSVFPRDDPRRQETRSLPFPVLTRLMMIELGTDAAKLVSVRGLRPSPITADDILEQVKGGVGVSLLSSFTSSEVWVRRCDEKNEAWY